jgi:anti-sigma regulatory factor (Ser/Thr protein kinase)
MVPQALPFVAPKLAALVLPSELGLEKAARAVGGELALAWGYSGEQVENIKPALAEATMNAIEHGNGQDANLPVRVMFTATADSLRMQVMDAGKKSLPKTLPEPGQGDMRGWGLFLISNLMDEFEIEHLPEGGNLVQMAVKKAPAPLNGDLAKNGKEKPAEK